MKEKLIKLIDAKTIKTNKPEEGFLLVAENMENIPFEIKRVYCMFCNDKDIVRGNHAHKKLKQAMICISGSCKIMLDDGHSQESIILNSPNKFLFIDRGLIWRKISEFSDNCILMVLADSLYDESDYIRNYEEFLNLAKDRS